MGESPRIIMSSHLHLLVTFLFVFDTSYTLLLQTPFLLESSSADIVEQTRTQADTLKTSLKSLSSKPEAAPILERIFKAKKGDCIKNMDQAIETSTRLFEKAGTEMKLLVQYVQEFQTINGTSKAVRQSAKIIRLLDVLIPKLTPSSFGCQKTSEDVLKSMRSLGAIVLDFSSENELYTSTHGRQNLKTSAQILSKVADFLTKESHFEFDHFCTKDKEHNKGFITAVGKMMIDLADLYADLGGVAASFEFRN